MRLLVLVFLGYFISSVVACFGEYGVYERTLYWYAYKLDVAVHGKPRQIAERCTRNKAKSECNFQEFLNFIDKSPSPKRIAGDISGNSVDELAQTLRDHGYTGKYKPHHVISSILDEPEQMGALFNRVSKIQLVNVPDINPSHSSRMPWKASRTKPKTLTILRSAHSSKTPKLP